MGDTSWGPEIKMKIKFLYIYIEILGTQKKSKNIGDFLILFLILGLDLGDSKMNLKIENKLHYFFLAWGFLGDLGDPNNK